MLSTSKLGLLTFDAIVVFSSTRSLEISISSRASLILARASFCDDVDDDGGDMLYSPDRRPSFGDARTEPDCFFDSTPARRSRSRKLAKIIDAIDTYRKVGFPDPGSRSC